MRGGELWESAAVPEIGAQAADVAVPVMTEPPLTYGAASAGASSAIGRRTVAPDLMGLPLSTTRRPPRVGGSAAQREVVEQPLLHCLVAAGRYDQALAVLDARQDRRPSLLDLRRCEKVAV